jgi:hypothetical protein
MTAAFDHDQRTSCGPTPHTWTTAAERLTQWHELIIRQAIRIDAGLPPLDMNHEFDRAVTRMAIDRYRVALAPFLTNALLSLPPSSGMVGILKRYRTAHAMAVRTFCEVNRLACEGSCSS